MDQINNNNIEQQIFDQIKKSGKIMIFLPENLNADSLGSSLALRLFLKKLQKEVTVVSSGQLPESLKFLPGHAEIKTALTFSKSLVISVDTSVKKLDELSYQTSDSKVQIYLKSQNSEFNQQDVSFANEKFPVDLIITLDCKSLESLGKLYEQNADLLYETPKINIDNKPGNEYFGNINLVDVTATSVAEVLVLLFQKFEQELIDEDIATCLLAGIISKTNSFQHVRTTPKSFVKAGELVSLGGRQQEIIKNIYKTKSLALLKLWGRALARMKTLETAKVIYSSLSQTDFEKSESGETEVLPTLKEFVDNINGYSIVGLLTEPAKGIFNLTVAIDQQTSAEKFLKEFGSQSKILNFNLGSYKVVEIREQVESLEALENKFLEAIKNIA